MSIRTVKFPVTCPICNTEFLSALRAAEVEKALRSGDQVQLYASCHDLSWPASEYEVQQIKDYLQTVDLTVPRQA